MKRYTRRFFEAAATNGQELATEVENIICHVFPHSYTTVQYSDGFGGHPSIAIRFALGKDKSEWINSIIENDILYHIAFIRGFSKDGTILGNLTFELSSGSLKLKSEDKFRAFKMVKLPFRKVTGTADRILQTIDRYYKNMKTLAEENKHNIPDEDMQLIGHKL